jgi:hypothetical protein
LQEYVCITVVSNPGEGEHAFSARLSQFWTHMLRNYKDDFEKVYAETTEFEEDDDCQTRQYLAEPDVVDLVTAEMTKANVQFRPVDPDDTYTKYEAVPPDWMQIEH